jgi:hypothetical protein
MTKTFRFDARGDQRLCNPLTPLSVSFTLPKPATGDGDPIALRMLREGMLAIPDDLQGLSREDLAERGYHLVKWHARYKRRYVRLAKKRHDS